MVTPLGKSSDIQQQTDLTRFDQRWVKRISRRQGGGRALSIEQALSYAMDHGSKE
jgi:hypothetical protein